MAENKKHSFDLNKGKPKRHFDLRKDSEIEEMAPTVEQPKPENPIVENASPEKPASETPAPNKPESKKLSLEKADNAADNLEASAVIPPAHFEDEEEQNVKRTKWWIYICGVAILIGLLIWLFCEMHWKAEHQGEPQEIQTEEIEAQPAVEAETNQTEVPEVTLPTEEVTAPEETSSAGSSYEIPVTATSTPETPTQTSSTPSANAVSSPNNAISPSSLSSDNIDVEAEAMNVIAGKYGNGQDRKDRLGQNYRRIQDRVNEKKRNGEF